jgi:hypothetical protein
MERLVRERQLLEPGLGQRRDNGCEMCLVDGGGQRANGRQ